MFVDSFEKIGHGKYVCQDYIIHNNSFSGIPYTILSDGCSSSKNTDIGTRLLAYTARNIISCIYEEDFTFYESAYTFLGKEIISRATNIAAMLEIPDTCIFDATLIFSFKRGNDIYVWMYGDGYIIAGDKNSHYKLKVSFPNSAPNYLSYYLHSRCMNEYKSRLNPENIKYIEDSKYRDICTVSADTPIVLRFNIINDPIVLIASDGLNSFVCPETRNGYSDDKLINEILDIKTINKNFLQIKMRKLLRNLSKQGTYNYDDISIGGYINEEILK